MGAHPPRRYGRLNLYSSDYRSIDLYRLYRPVKGKTKHILAILSFYLEGSQCVYIRALGKNIMLNYR